MEPTLTHFAGDPVFAREFGAYIAHVILGAVIAASIICIWKVYFDGIEIDKRLKVALLVKKFIADGRREHHIEPFMRNCPRGYRLVLRKNLQTYCDFVRGLASMEDLKKAIDEI
jgi:hypothetical protein